MGSIDQVTRYRAVPVPEGTLARSWHQEGSKGEKTHL
jgi:hypothetical protein